MKSHFVAVIAFTTGVLTCGIAYAVSRRPIVPPAVPSWGDTIAIPQEQAALCALVADRSREYRNARQLNELRRSAIRDARQRDFAAQSPNVTDWIGTVVDLGTNGDGKAYVSVKLACGRGDVTAHTWTMAITDAADETMIAPSDPRFVVLSTLAPGARVRFSGTFIDWRETSLTERGGMRAPELVFRFTAVAPAP